MPSPIDQAEFLIIQEQLVELPYYLKTINITDIEDNYLFQIKLDIHFFY